MFKNHLTAANKISEFKSTYVQIIQTEAHGEQMNGENSIQETCRTSSKVQTCVQLESQKRGERE